MDRFGRVHDYLRISLIEKCNLRCTYCMPEQGIPLSPKSHLMTSDEVFALAKTFVDLGVKKIRFTGGEPLLRKDFDEILRKVAELPVELAITTNGILLDRYYDLLLELNVRSINVSLDTLDSKKFEEITRRNQFDRVMKNIELFNNEHFDLKVNAVLMRGFNESELVDFVEMTQHSSIAVRFIEFMPFGGNKWEEEKTVTLADILGVMNTFYGEEKVVSHAHLPNETSKIFHIEGYQGTFGVISSVTSPFCGDCNRMRLTADGKMKNCLFGQDEKNLLSALREGQDIESLIRSSVHEKHEKHGGLSLDNENADSLDKNRSMILIGG
ncbi:GTP 3',8-cyclase [Aureibacter tunicatorum]|nr:GTP 3',8-cyclase [Aureibacter tunicatorum]